METRLPTLNDRSVAVLKGNENENGNAAVPGSAPQVLEAGTTPTPA